MPDVCLRLDTPWLNLGVFLSFHSLCLGPFSLFHHCLLSNLVFPCDDTLHKLGSLHASLTNVLFLQQQNLG